MRGAALLRRTAGWLAAGAVLLAASATQATTAHTTYTHGYDVSWPQCSGTRAVHMPSSPGYMILGLTHGAGHTKNPCLASQLAWARSHHALVGAYLVPSYPTAADLARASSGPYGECDSADTKCRAANDGVAQANDALAAMHAAGVPAPMVWIDVEFRHVHPWSKNQTVNARVVAGVARGLQLAGMPYGVYTTSYMWQHIVGSYRLAAPNWLPAGSGKPSEARAMCGKTGSGGTTWLAQYTSGLDQNLTCPVMDAYPGHPGPLWPYRNTTLALGSTGQAVAALQKALAVPVVSGTYDAPTVTAVAAFQAQKALPVDGRVDRDDWTALGAFALVGGHPFLLPKVAAPVA